MARRTGIGVRSATGGTGSGGTAYNPGAKPAPKPQGGADPSDYIEPPVGSFDPSIEAQRREAARGLEDKEHSIAEQEHFAGRDLAHALHNLKTGAVRGRQDINRSASRGLQTIGNQEQDINTKGQRANQDFATSLANIARSFGQLGHRQGESENAAGVNDAGTQAAASAARAQNQGLAEAPIRTAQGRENEDLATALGRLGTSRTQVGEDQTRSTTRLEQNHEREAKQAKRETGQKAHERFTEGQEAKVEAQAKNVDLLAEEIYAARAEHPAIFRNWKQEHPEAIEKAEDKAGGAGAPPKTGGTSAGGKKPKKKGGR